MNNTEIKNKLKGISESKLFKKIIFAFGILIIALFIFRAGVFVGFHRAAFGRDWENNYGDNFGMMHRGPRMGDMYDHLPNAHGAVGKILKAELPTIIVLDKDNTEKVIVIKKDTKIRNGREDGTESDLKVDSYIVVIGSPNSAGQIEAKLIRIIPAPFFNTPASTIQ